MDNRSIDITACGADALNVALDLCLMPYTTTLLTHYKVMNILERVDYVGAPINQHRSKFTEYPNGSPTLFLLRTYEEGAQELPYPMDSAEACGFAYQWLSQLPALAKVDYDGDVRMGWRLICDEWQSHAGLKMAIAAIQPARALFHN